MNKQLTNKIGAFVLSGCAAIAPMVNALYNATFDTVRLMMVLLGLFAAHVLMCPKVSVTREFAYYAMFLLYMIVSLLWTPNPLLGLNTIVPAINFTLILVLFASLVSSYDLRAVLAGLTAGYVFGAVAYTLVEGFPFVYPRGFSYNAAAAMYFFGLFVALLYSVHGGSRRMVLGIGFVSLLLIAATTSIKTNLGIALGVLVSGFVFFNRSLRIAARNAPGLIVIAIIVIYNIASNENVVRRLERSAERVSAGIAVLQSGQDAENATSYGMREAWAAVGIEGWVQNPVFGYGVEAFRAHNGITSHSTPIDLLYNTGLIGFLLFYAMFASLLWRLFRTRGSSAEVLRPAILAALVCHCFMTLSGTLLYQSFLAVFVALSAGLLSRYEASPAALDSTSQVQPRPVSAI